MNNEEYNLICEICDGLLKEPSVTPERISIAWLHVLNEHPVTLKKYDTIFDRKPLFGLKIKLILWNIVQLVKAVLKSSKFHLTNLVSGPIDTILVSHLLNSNQIGQDEDFYFGKMADYLNDSGKNCLFVYFNHTSTLSEKANQLGMHARISRVVLPEYLSLKEELFLRWKLYQEYKILKRDAKSKAKSEIEKRVLEVSAAKLFSPDTIATYRFHYIMNRISSSFLPSTVLTTYEGHAWERLAYLAARSANWAVKCIGYQHAVIFKNQHAMKRKLTADYDPDVLMTAGEVTLEVLSSVPELKSIEMSCVGTHRMETGLESLLLKLPVFSENVCLVIPDGTIEECITIFDFVFLSAELDPRIQFVIRLHPVMPLSVISKHYTSLSNLPSNIAISENSISDDFSTSRWALYRGSGAAIRAVTSGLRPFYVNKNNELPIDPLHQLTVWRKIVQSPEEFVSLMLADMSADIYDLEVEYREAASYCQRYFMPVDEERIRTVVCNSRSNLHGTRHTHA